MAGSGGHPRGLDDVLPEALSEALTRPAPGESSRTADADPLAPALPPLFLHVGLPKSGTTFLQALLANNRLRLKDAGYIYPFVRPECMFHAAVELREQHERWGLAPEFIDGTWSQLLDRVTAFGGAGVISHEILAGALEPTIERIAADVAERDLDLHVVVTARDLARQASAHWQEQVKNGRRWTFEEFGAELFLPGESEANEVGFWRSQHLASVLDRWGAVVAADHVHVVTVPPDGADPWELWRRFAAALALDPRSLDLELEPRANESLGNTEVALLRAVVEALDGRLGQPHYAHVVKRYFAQGQLARFRSPRPVAPPALRSRLHRMAQRWVALVEAAGHPVHGDLADLLPAHTPAGVRHPDEVRAEDLVRHVPEILAELLLEIAALRSETTGPKALPPLVLREGEERDRLMP